MYFYSKRIKVNGKGVLKFYKGFSWTEFIFKVQSSTPWTIGKINENFRCGLPSEDLEKRNLILT